jgi:hypothetical protein
MYLRKWFAFLAVILLIVPVLVQGAEEEPAQTRPSPFTKNSQTMTFMIKAFGSFNQQSINSLKEGETIQMTLQRQINARDAGFSAGKGQILLVSMRNGGICLQKGRSGKRTKGVILENSSKNNKLLMTSRINNATFQGTMALNDNNMQFQAKPVK